MCIDDKSELSLYYCLLYSYTYKILFLGLHGSVENIIIKLQINGTKSILSMLENTTLVVKAVNIPLNASALIFQAHSQTEELTMSEHPEALIESRVIGKNIGLVVRLKDFETQKSIWLTNKSQKKINVLLVISSMDPSGNRFLLLLFVF